jgi:hypothetical protein
MQRIVCRYATLHRGAYIVSHHINSPGVLVIQDFLAKFRDDLQTRGCSLVIASLVRDPVVGAVQDASS